MKHLILAVALLATPACSLLEKLPGEAAKANGKALAVSKHVLCKASRVENLMDKFSTREKARLWCEFCEEERGFCALLARGE